ncbi:unnamed protein product [Prunus armeniaca]
MIIANMVRSASVYPHEEQGEIYSCSSRKSALACDSYDIETVPNHHHVRGVDSYSDSDEDFDSDSVEDSDSGCVDHIDSDEQNFFFHVMFPGLLLNTQKSNQAFQGKFFGLVKLSILEIFPARRQLVNDNSHLKLFI